MNKYTTDKIIKMLDIMISAGDINDDVNTLIEVIDRCLALIHDLAKYRTSPYSDVRKVGEGAYSSILNWQRLLSDWRDEL